MTTSYLKKSLLTITFHKIKLKQLKFILLATGRLGGGWDRTNASLEPSRPMSMSKVWRLNGICGGAGSAPGGVGLCNRPPSMFTIVR